MPLNIAIVGGGVGGPAAAIGLARNGHNVTLYERLENCLDGVGFAFRIMPNSDLCLKFLGIDTVAGGAVTANPGRMMTYDGTVVGEIKENTDPEKAKKAASVFAYRPSLQQQLLDAAVESGALIKTGVKVTSADVSKGTLGFEDGTTASADLIIAADGIHSSIRPHIVNSSKYYPKASTGQGCIRFTIPKKTVADDPVASRGINNAFRMYSWKGEGKRIIVYAVDYGRQYNFNCTHPVELSTKETSGDDSGNADAIAYNQPISQSATLSIYAEFDDVSRRLLELADPAGLRVWKLLDLDDLPRWSAGRVVLLGDACHAVLPFGFSGAGMAIEDAVTLAMLFPGDVSVVDVEERLAVYEKIRRPRVARVREASRVVGGGAEDIKYLMDYMEFLSSHDAVETAREALNALKEGCRVAPNESSSGTQESDSG